MQERILEFRLSPKMYDDDDEMELTQSARLLAQMCNKSDADSSNIRMEKRRHKEKKHIPALKEKEREDFSHHTQDVTKKGTSDRR